MRAGDFETACPKLAESYRLEPSIGTLINQGICEEALGRLATAWAKFRQVLDTAPASDDRVPIAQQHIVAIEPKLPRLRIELPKHTPKDATVVLDGLELRRASLSSPLPVNPGEHSVTLTTQDGVTTQTVVAKVGEIATCRVEPKTTPAKGSATPNSPTDDARAGLNIASASTPTKRPRSSLRTASYVAGGIGAAAMLTAAVFGVLALQARETKSDNCDPNNHCNQDGIDAGEAGRRYVRISDISLVVGIAGLSSGGILYWQSSRSPSTTGVRSAGVFIGYRGTLP